MSFFISSLFLLPWFLYLLTLCLSGEVQRFPARLGVLLLSWYTGTAARQSLSDVYRFCILDLYLKLDLFFRPGNTLFSVSAKKWIWGIGHTIFEILLDLWVDQCEAASETNEMFSSLLELTALPKDERLELMNNHTYTNTSREAERGM